MGLDTDMLLFLADCRSSGASFDKMLTIGRQASIMDLHSTEKILKQIGCFDNELFDDLRQGKNAPFADEAFRMLGAKQLDALDYSDFEGASVIHDLNMPLPEEMKGKYDFVFDGGTLEHVFRCHEALRSYMDLCKVGGSLVVAAPANNWMGHGFYQLSPDFYYRSLCEENGFEVRRMIITALGPFKNWYEVADPKEIGERIELISLARQMIIMVHAVKKKDVDVFSTIPQQQSYEADDYTKMEEDRLQKQEKKSAVKKGSGFMGLSAVLKAFRTAWLFYTTYTILNKKYFKKVSRWPSSGGK